MSKEKSLPAGGFFHELFHVGIYKRSQGRITRQVTFAVIAVTTGLGAWRLFETQDSNAHWLLKYFLPGALLIAGIWLGYRIVNLSKFADFLIAVEAEMNKVSWPSRAELFRSSVVVIFVIFALAMILFGYDTIWTILFTKWLGVKAG